MPQEFSSSIFSDSWRGLSAGVAGVSSVPCSRTQRNSWGRKMMVVPRVGISLKSKSGWLLEQQKPPPQVFQQPGASMYSRAYISAQSGFMHRLRSDPQLVGDHFAVDLAVRADRQARHKFEAAWHHVFGQPLPGLGD